MTGCDKEAAERTLPPPMSPAPGAFFLPTTPQLQQHTSPNLWPYSTHLAAKVSTLGTLEARELLKCQVGSQELKQEGFQAGEPVVKAILRAAPHPNSEIRSCQA